MKKKKKIIWILMLFIIKKKRIFHIQSCLFIFVSIKKIQEINDSNKIEKYD